MNKQQLTELAFNVNARKGIIEKNALINLCSSAGVSYTGTFKGINKLDGALINKLLNLAHKRVDVDIEKAKNTVIITGQSDYQAHLVDTLNKSIQELQSPETDNEEYDRVCSEIWKSRRGTK